MDEATRFSLLQVLGREMSDISEDAYCAGWLGGTEYFVPELCRRAVESGRPQYWGHWAVTPEYARGLVYIAEQIGCWADSDHQSEYYMPHQPFPCPAEYADALDQEQALELARLARQPE